MRNRGIIFGIAALCTFTNIARAGEDPNAPIDTSKYDHVVKLACVGDSITLGVGTTNRKLMSWPAVLGRMLGEKWSVENFGSSSCTLLNHGDFPYQTKGAFKQALASQPDVVVIFLGTNDTKPQNWTFNDEFPADYKNMIEQFQKLPTHARIFICHPPAVPDGGNDGINEPDILAEIPMIDQVAKDEATGLIDIHAATVNHPEVFKDHIHPNNAGAAIIAKAMFKALTGADFVGEIPASQPAAN